MRPRLLALLAAVFAGACALAQPPSPPTDALAKALAQEIHSLRQALGAVPAVAKDAPQVIRHLTRNLSAEAAKDLDAAARIVETAASAAGLAPAQEMLAEARRRIARIALFAAKAQTARGLPPGAAFAVCQESGQASPVPGLPYAGRPAASAQVHLAQNEFEAVQLVAVPIEFQLDGLHVTAGAFVGPGGARLPQQDITVRRVGSIEVEPPAPAQPSLLPDPLLDNAPCDVPHHGFEAYWITFRARPDTRPGDYRGFVTFSPANAPSVAVTVTVFVRAFALPASGAFRVALDLSPAYLAARTGASMSPGMPSGWEAGTWTRGAAQTCKTVLDASSSRSQPASLRLESPAPAPGETAAQAFCHTGAVEFAPNAQYLLSFWYRSQSGAIPAGRCELRGLASIDLADEVEWTRVTRLITVGEPAKANVSFTALTPGRLWIDDVSLRRVDPLGPELLPAFGFNDKPGLSLGELILLCRLNMLDHRVSDPDATRPAIDGDSIDWERFDEAMTLLRSRGQDALSLAWLRPEGGWGNLFDAKPETPKRLYLLLTQTQQHLDAKGWTSLAWLPVAEEPAAALMADVKTALQFIRQSSPKLKTFCSFDEPAASASAQLDGLVDIWAFDREDFKPAFVAAQRRDGREVWLSVPPSAPAPWALNVPGPSQRALCWRLWRRGFTGLCGPSINAWRQDPWRHPARDAGAVGWLVYPSPQGAVDSIRWEILRDSIEDAGYLALLDGLLQSAKTLQPNLWERRKDLLNVDAITAAPTSGAIETRRQQIAEAIEELGQALKADRAAPR